MILNIHKERSEGRSVFWHELKTRKALELAGMRAVISGKTCPILEESHCLEGVTTSSGVSRPKYLRAAGMPVRFSGRKASPPVCSA